MALCAIVALGAFAVLAPWATLAVVAAPFVFLFYAGVAVVSFIAQYIAALVIIVIVGPVAALISMTAAWLIGRQKPPRLEPVSEPPSPNACRENCGHPACRNGCVV